MEPQIAHIHAFFEVRHDPGDAGVLEFQLVEVHELRYHWNRAGKTGLSKGPVEL